jgi:hypothetical protein
VRTERKTSYTFTMIGTNKPRLANKRRKSSQRAVVALKAA